MFARADRHHHRRRYPESSVQPSQFAEAASSTLGDGAAGIPFRSRERPFGSARCFVRVDVRSWKGGGEMHEAIKAEIGITRVEQLIIRRSGTPELEAACTAHLDELLEEYAALCARA
jgi:hypothetical protein